MFKFSNTSLGRFRLIAMAEGISYAVLLLIAMPIKYMAGYPEVVKYTGWVHGVLFVAYLLSLINVQSAQNWPVKRSILAFIISITPFAAFFFDKSLRREEEMIFQAARSRKA